MLRSERVQTDFKSIAYKDETKANRLGLASIYVANLWIGAEEGT